ncbi:MAG: SulP family inorganic anion transporter [Gammaproteobacteria bacterium]
MIATLRRDLPASLVVFLVAVPLSLGIALASGAPIVAGLIGAMVGGIVTGLLAGSPLQVSGPAAGLTVVVAGFIDHFGWPTMCLITACAGVLQFVMGYFKVARGALMIAPSVVHGMLAGIGITIVMAQIHVVMGGSPLSSPVANLLALPERIGAINLSAAMLGTLTILILVVWKKITGGVLKVIPAALVAVAAATIVSVLMKADVARVDLPDSFSLTPMTLPTEWSAFAIAILTVALIASIESLLCAVATDKLHRGVRSDLDKELSAQGVGNFVSGLLGGLPVTGVIVRSSANITANAATRWSGVMHGLWVLVFTLFFSRMIETIPLSVLAGLLVYTGVNLVDLQQIHELKKHKEALVFFATLAGVLVINLLAGVGIGLALSTFFVLQRLSRTEIHCEQRDGNWHVVIDGSLTFASVPKLASELAKLPAGSTVLLDLAADFIDHAAFEALHGWRLNHEKAGGKVDIDEAHEAWYHPASQGKPRLHKLPKSRKR